MWLTLEPSTANFCTIRTFALLQQTITRLLQVAKNNHAIGCKTIASSCGHKQANFCPKPDIYAVYQQKTSVLAA